MTTTLGDYFDRTWHLNIGIIAACPFYEPEGTALRVDGLATALGDLGHEVHICTYHLGETPDDRPYSIGRTNSLPFYGKTEPGPDFRKPLIDTLLLQKSLRDFKGFEPDLLIGSHVEGGFIGSLLKNKFGVPLIYDAHGSFAEEMTDFNWIPEMSLLKRPFDAIEDYIVRQADAVGCVSSELESRLSARTSSSVPITFLPNGVNLEDFEASESKRSALDVGESDFLLVCAGNPKDDPNVQALFDALGDLDRDDVHLLLLEGPQDEIQDHAEAVGIAENVTFPGEIPPGEQPAYLISADCLVAAGNRTKTEEEQTDSLVRFLAAGKPIIATDVPAHHALADGETALLVPEASSDALAEAIETLLEDDSLREKLGSSARERARDFQWTQSGERIIDLYRRITNDQVLSVQGG